MAEKRRLKDVSSAFFPELFPFEVKYEPIYENHCGHPKESYLGSVSYYVDRKGTEAWIDVYVFEAKGRQEVCLRHSNEPSDYSSVGTVLDLLISAATIKGMNHYKNAAALILELMSCKFTQTETIIRNPIED
jgi:hypothetical protein